jgi:hypothetical protein
VLRAGNSRVAGYGPVSSLFRHAAWVFCAISSLHDLKGLQYVPGSDVRPATCRNPRQVCRVENNKSGTRDVLRTVSKNIYNGLEAPAGICVPRCSVDLNTRMTGVAVFTFIWPHIITYLAHSVSATIPFGHPATRAPGMYPYGPHRIYMVLIILGQQGINKYAHPCNCSLGSPRMAGCLRDRRGKYVVDTRSRSMSTQ